MTKMGVVDTLCTVVLAELKTHSRVVIGVSGPQGSGKTTATRLAAERLKRDHSVPTVSVSIDDFYKPYTDLQVIAKRNNPLLKHRGLPGTHDVDLAATFMQSFLNGKPAVVPVYDKSLHSGAGDRCGSIDLPADTQVVLFEGWMVGFHPVGTEIIAAKVSDIEGACISVKPTRTDLEEIDANLKDYLPIWNSCSSLVHLKPQSLSFIYKWRLDQEHELIRTKGRGMSDSQVHQFVDQYIPAYIVYNQTLANMVSSNIITLDENHQAIPASSHLNASG